MAQASSYRPVHDKEHPPLDGDFFAKTARLAESTTAVRSDMNSLRTSIASDPAFYDPWIRGSVTMEQFFADVYYAVASSTPPAAALEVFIKTIRLYRRVLAQTTNWAMSTTRRGDLDRFLRMEFALADGGMTVVTFNHDLLIESVAADIKKYDGRWCLRSLYGDVGLRNLNWGSGSRFNNHVAACPHDPPFTVLKLHGSLNWLIRSRAENPDLSTLFPSRRTNRDVHVANRADILIDPKIGSRPRPGGRSWYMWPLVVPPIYEKQRITGMALLQEVWDLAYDAIVKADRLVFFGYSIPEADVLARQMLRTAVRQNVALKCVECVNPDAAITPKLKDVLDASAIRLYRDVETYLAYQP